MKIQLDVSRITILKRNGTDLVYLVTNHPSPFPPEVSPEPLWVSFEVQAGRAEEYLVRAFGACEVEVIHMDTGLRETVLLERCGD